MTKIRAKFQVVERRITHYGTTSLVLRPQYDTTIPEDQRFAKATPPSGELTMQIDNPTALEALPLGQFFYLDLVPVGERETVAAGG